MQPREFVKTLSARPLHELGDILNWHYPAVCGDAAKIKGYLRKFDRPYLSGEYAHAYGLDFGLLEWYWDDIMWNDPSYAGGAVWMFHDQGILRKADDMSADERRNCVWPDKDHVWDSARDLGTDGVVYSDRTLQSDYFEMRKVYAPVRLGAADVKFVPGGRLRFSAPVENRFDSVALDKGAKGRWRLFADRREVAGGELGMPPLPPHAKGVLSFEADSPGAEASIWRLELSFDSPRTGFSLYERSYPVKVELPRTEAAGDIVLGFDAATKEVVVRSSGAEIFRSPVLARVDRRSMLSKDRKTNQYDRWTPNALEPSSVEVVSCGDGHLTLDVLWRPKAHTSKKEVKGRRELSGRISLKAESGKIKVDYALEYACARKLVETGIAFELPAKYRRFDWVGLGPYECYPRVSMLSEFGVWAYDRDDLCFPGNRREVRMVLSSAADGSVVSLECPGNGSDVAFERRGEKTLLAHNAFVAGKACKFNDPLEMADFCAGEKLTGSFVLTPKVKMAGGALSGVFGELREIAPFKPFFKTYD
jgi:beta-galactosidase